MSPFFHLSPTIVQHNVWVPRQSTWNGVDSGGSWIERLPVRVCVAPSIAQCAQAIYPDVWEELEHVGHKVMHVYQPTRIPDGTTSDIKHTVFDAEITGESIYTKPVEMKYTGRVIIHNPERNKYQEVMTALWGRCKIPTNFNIINLSLDSPVDF